MKKFSEFITEAQNDSFAITIDEFDNYAKAIEKTNRSKDFVSLLWLVGQYELLFDREKLESVLNGKFLTNLFDICPANIQKDIYKLAKKVGNEVKLLPQLLSAEQRQAVIDNEIDPNDLTLDLESKQGRDEVARRYLPMINKMVNQFYKGDDCVLTKQDLMSAAFAGLAEAIKSYKNPSELKKYREETGDTKKRNVSFTSYVAYKIKFQILGDIEDYARTVKISNYNKKKFHDEHGEDANLPTEFSINNFKAHNGDGEEIEFDEFFGLGGKGDHQIEATVDFKLKKEIYQKIFDRIKTKFSARDVNIFFRVNGIMGFKQEPAKDLAKEFGVSAPFISQQCGKIAKFIANDKVCLELWKSIQESVGGKLTIDPIEMIEEDYLVNKLAGLLFEDKKTIVESLLFDDYYIMLESLIKWNSKDKFQKAVNKATDTLNVDDALFIYNILQNKALLDEKSVKKYKDAIIRFLENMYPDQSFKSAKIEDLVAELNDLRTISLKYSIIW